MQTLSERITDSNKVSLSKQFIKDMLLIGTRNNLSGNDVYQKWNQYAKQCEMWDQSPVMFEFCQVNGWDN